MIRQARTMVFKEEKGKLVFLGENYYQNPLLEIQDTSNEEALQLASELGLEQDSQQPSVWRKGSPWLWLYHDGSCDAEVLLCEIRQLEVPYEIQAGSKELTLRTRQRIYPRMRFDMPKIIQVIRRTASQHQSKAAQAA